MGTREGEGGTQGHKCGRETAQRERGREETGREDEREWVLGRAEPPLNFPFLQDIGRVGPLQCSGSGMMNVELPAEDSTPAALPSSSGCATPAAQGLTRSPRWGA